MREGGSEHPTGRQQIARQIAADMSGEELENIQRTASDIKNNPDQSSLSKAERSRLLFKELKKPESPLVRGGGVKVKAPSDFSKVTMSLMKSLGISPQKVLDAFEGGTEQQIQSKLLKLSAEEIQNLK